MALALTSLEKIGLEFFSQKNSKSLSFFLQKLEVFCGVKPGPFGPPTIHLAPHEIKLGFITKNIEFLTEMSKEAVFPLLSLSFGRKAPRFFHRLCHFFVSNATYEAEILKVNHKFYFQNMF